jgi:hypothetical protein
MGTIPRPIPGFVPVAPPVTSNSIDTVLESHTLVAIHFWAVSNGADPLMDASIAKSTSDAYFVSCDVSNSDCHELCRRCGVVTTPSIAVFLNGELQPLILGVLNQIP